MIRDRIQATIRAENRYLFLLLLISAYTLGVHFTAGNFAEVPFLGLKVPRQLVEAFAVSALGVLMLAIFGTEEVLERLLAILPAVFGVERLLNELVESEPSLLDFLVYCTFLKGDQTRITLVGWLVLYPAPLVGALLWAIRLWWTGIHSCLHAWPWLVAVHGVNALILVFAFVRLVILVKAIWDRIKSFSSRP